VGYIGFERRGYTSRRCFLLFLPFVYEKLWIFEGESGGDSIPIGVLIQREQLVFLAGFVAVGFCFCSFIGFKNTFSIETSWNVCGIKWTRYLIFLCEIGR
jgi:hypothetical protein